MMEAGFLRWYGQDFVLVVDYHSIYWKIERLYKANAETTVRKIIHIFKNESRRKNEK